MSRTIFQGQNAAVRGGHRANLQVAFGWLQSNLDGSEGHSSSGIRFSFTTFDGTKSWVRTTILTFMWFRHFAKRVHHSSIPSRSQPNHMVVSATIMLQCTSTSTFIIFIIHAKFETDLPRCWHSVFLYRTDVAHKTGRGVVAGTSFFVWQQQHKVTVRWCDRARVVLTWLEAYDFQWKEWMQIDSSCPRYSNYETSCAPKMDDHNNISYRESEGSTTNDINVVQQL